MGRLAHTGEKRNVCRALAGKPEGNRPLEIPSLRLEDNIQMYFKNRMKGCRMEV